MIIRVINILDLMAEIGGSYVDEQLSLFSCPNNPEIETYLKTAAVDFAKRAFLLLISFSVNQHKVSRTAEKRIVRFADFSKATNTYSLASPLIAQFGKNYSPLIPQKISGNKLMELAINQLYIIQHLSDSLKTKMV